MAVSITSGIEQTASALEDSTLETQEKKAIPSSTVTDSDVEVGTSEEPEKTYYSKLSVWLMVLFSGLAIGSDG